MNQPALNPTLPTVTVAAFDPILKFRRGQKAEDKQTDDALPPPTSIGRDRLPTVEDVSGFSRASIYRLVRSGQFPAPIKLGGNSIGWRLSTIHARVTEREQGSAA